MKTSILQFNGGEISPYLRHANNLEKHPSSVQLLENFLPMPTGGIRKRPGTIHLHGLNTTNQIAPTFRLAVFEGYLPEYSTEQAANQPTGNFILCFDKTRLTILDSNGKLYTSFTYQEGHSDPAIRSSFPPRPHFAAGIKDPQNLRFLQINDVFFIVSPTFPPQKLTRLPQSNGGSQFALQDLYFSTPPFLDENTDDAKILTTSGNTSTIGGSVTLNSNFPLFSAAHIGSTFEISRRRLPSEYQVQFPLGSSTANSSTLNVKGQWTLQTFGTWTGRIDVERSDNGGSTWEAFRTYNATGDRNISVDGDERSLCLLRVKWTPEGNGNLENSPRVILSALDPFLRGRVQITSYTSQTQATALVQQPISAGSTSYWTEGAFSQAQGFPSAIALHDRRLVFASTSQRPTSLWFSQVDDFLNFERGTDDSASIYATFASTRREQIQWLVSARRLFVGTTHAEWVFGSDSDELITPKSITVRPYTNYGSSPIPALPANDTVFFVERQGRRLRELSFYLERDTFDAQDLSRLAEHITESGIRQIAYQANREPFLWLVRNDGMALSFAYNRNEKIAAWSRHTTPFGKFQSVAVSRRQDGDDDVFFVIARTAADGSTSYNIEKFQRASQAAQESGDPTQQHYLDAATIQNETDLRTLKFAAIASIFDQNGNPITNKPTIMTVNYGDGNAEIRRYTETTTLEFTHEYITHGTYNVTLTSTDEATNQIVSTAALTYNTTSLTSKINILTSKLSPALTNPRTILLDGNPAELTASLDGKKSLRIGLGYTARLITLPLDIPTQNGSTHSHQKRLKAARLFVQNSRGGHLIYNRAAAEPIRYNLTTSDEANLTPPLITDWTNNALGPVGYLRDLQLEIRHTDPTPFMATTLMLDWETTESMA